MLSAILARLQAQCPSFEVIAEAPGGDAITTADAYAASSALKTLLEGAVGAAYPILAPETKNPPDAIYTLVSALPVEVEDVRLITAVTFIVTLRATGYIPLTNQLSAVETALAASSDAVSITNAAFDHDEKRNHYLADIELTYAVPAVPGGNNWPALLVEPAGYQAQPPAEYPIDQDVSRACRLVILTADNDILELHNEVKAALLGWPASEDDLPHYYQQGQKLSLPGGLSAWVDTYTDTTWYRQ